MSGIEGLAASGVVRTLVAGEVLIAEGEEGGHLYVLEDGQLTVERGGVTLATISQPNALIGEMSVLLGTRNSATVRAVGAVTLREVADAAARLRRDPELAFRMAALLAARLEATSALLVNLSGQTPKHDERERGLLASIFAALTSPSEAEIGVITRRDIF